MLKLLLLIVVLIPTTNADKFGPHQVLGVEMALDAKLSTNTTAIQHVTSILCEYQFAGVFPEDNVFDCSNISEIIWYVLNNNGIDAVLVGNYLEHDGVLYAHMIVWVETEDGIIIVESLDDDWSENRIGKVVYDPPQLYTSGWVWDSPTEFLKVGNPSDMRGITLDTPIEELPIRRRA